MANVAKGSSLTMIGQAALFNAQLIMHPPFLLSSRQARHGIVPTFSCVALSAASADGSARVWDMEIGDCVLLMEGHTAAVTDLAVAETGSLLVTSSADHTARVWGLDKGQCKAVLQGHTAAVNAVVVDTRGRFAVTASADATGRVWDLHTGQCAHVLRGHGAGAAGAGMWHACLPKTCPWLQSTLGMISIAA